MPQIEQVLKTADKWHKRGEDGHVVFGGFDGDQNAYQALSDGYLDADGVQNLFLEVDMAFQAFKDMWAGKKPDKLLLDPGFVITAGQPPAEARRDVGLHGLEEEERPEPRPVAPAARTAASSTRPGDAHR